MLPLDPAFDRGSHRAVAGAGARLDLAMIAHDIRGALQGVFGGLAAIRSDELPADVRVQLQRVSAASYTIQGLSDELAILDGGGEIDMPGAGEVVLDEFIGAYRDRWAGEARSNRLGFEVSASGDLPVGLRVPRLSLSRVLGNLTANSIAYAGRGSVRLEVRRTADGDLVFQITDDGPGLGEDTLRQLDGSGLHEARSRGHGLGLYIVGSLTRQIGGRISVRNREQAGMLATLTFPPSLCVEPNGDRSPEPTPRPTVAPETPAPARGAVAEGGPAASGAPRENLAGLRILLAEDNPTNQMVASQMLEVLQAEVVLASDGVEALERFEEADFDIVVVDIEMPRLTGLDVIRTIRARGDARAKTPIVALTAYALREHRERIAEAGADGLISKPITGIEALARGLLSHVAPRSAPVAPPPSAGGEPDVPVVEAAVYGALAETFGPQMMADLLEKVAVDLTTARDDLAAAVETADTAAVRAASHIVVGVAGAVGAARLQRCARRLNTASNGNDPAAVARLVPECIAEIEAVVAFTNTERAGQ